MNNWPMKHNAADTFVLDYVMLDKSNKLKSYLSPPVAKPCYEAEAEAHYNQ